MCTDVRFVPGVNVRVFLHQLEVVETLIAVLAVERKIAGMFTPMILKGLEGLKTVSALITGKSFGGTLVN